MLKFKEWLLGEGFETGCKLGLYPPLEDALGQYPPLYAMARSADLITYIDMQYGSKGPDGKNGLINYHDGDPRHRLVRKKSRDA